MNTKPNNLEILVQYNGYGYIVRFNAFSATAINIDSHCEVTGILLDQLIDRAFVMCQLWYDGHDYLPLIKQHMRTK